MLHCLSLSLSILFGTFDSIDGAAAAAGKANILLNKLNAVVVARGRQEKGRKGEGHGRNFHLSKQFQAAILIINSCAAKNFC